MLTTENYMRAIRGPVLLIGLGVLLLVDHFGSFSFWRTWPMLLILLGLMVLLERVFATRPEPSSPGTSVIPGGPQG